MHGYSVARNVFLDYLRTVVSPKSDVEIQKSEIDLLGHYINFAGISPSPSKVETIKNFPLPDTMRKLRQFWGMINFY